MPETYNTALLIGAALSAIAALLHVAIVIGGPDWYRFFGAGERFATAAETGHIWPGVITMLIASVLALWAAYALSGAGVIAPIPLLRTGLVTITAVYLLRGLALFPGLLFARKKVTPFLFWSSLVCMAYGAVHLLGLVQVWPKLAS